MCNETIIYWFIEDQFISKLNISEWRPVCTLYERFKSQENSVCKSQAWRALFDTANFSVLTHLCLKNCHAPISNTVTRAERHLGGIPCSSPPCTHPSQKSGIYNETLLSVHSSCWVLVDAWSLFTLLTAIVFTMWLFTVFWWAPFFSFSFRVGVFSTQ